MGRVIEPVTTVGEVLPAVRPGSVNRTWLLHGDAEVGVLSRAAQTT